MQELDKRCWMWFYYTIIISKHHFFEKEMETSGSGINTHKGNFALWPGDSQACANLEQEVDITLHQERWRANGITTQCTQA